jgi:hypothetical protein
MNGCVTMVTVVTMKKRPGAMLKSSSLSSQPSPSIVPAKKSADFEAVGRENITDFPLPADGGMFRRT